MRALAAAALLILGGLVEASVLSAQGRSSVELLINAADYCNQVYIRSSQASYVYPRGEPVRIRIMIVNQGSAETTLRLPESPKLALAPQVASEVKLGPFENVRVVHAAGSEPIEWPRELRVDVGEHFEFEASLQPPDVPGVYAITFDSAIVDSSNKPLAPRANRFMFEMVHSSPGLAAEQALRRWCRASRENDDESASEAVRSLLEVHPNSYLAYSLRGQLAARRRDFNEARASYERAAVILETGLDLLYLEPRRGLRSSHEPTAAEFRRLAASLPR